MKHPLTLFLLIIALNAGAQRSSVTTFSSGDLVRLFQEACPGIGFRSNKFHAHRNSVGNMMYIASEDHREAIIYGSSQQCSELSSDTLDVWRDDKGVAVAQLINKDNMQMLMVGEYDPSRGKRFDVDRSGQYMCVSSGNTSVISAIARPYRTLLTLTNFDAQRIFIRKRALLLVGSNPATNLMEARVVRLDTGAMAEDAPLALGGMPAGITVHDYSEKSDDLLLGGRDAGGQSSFVIFNVTSGQSSGVTPGKPGDEFALFVSDPALRQRVSGGRPGTATAGPSSSTGSVSEQPQDEGRPQKRGGVFNIFRKKTND